MQTSIDGVVETMRELMNVPDTWTLTNLERGFVPPEGEVARRTIQTMSKLLLFALRSINGNRYAFVVFAMALMLRRC